LVVGNKVDMKESREVTDKQRKRWLKENDKLPALETSAKEGSGVTDTFHILAEMLL
jgi:ethanolamine utilization protein EutP (predicted NTPase)